MKSEKQVIYNDITNEVYQKISSMIKPFIEANEQDSEFRIIIDQHPLECTKYFSIKIKDKNVVDYYVNTWCSNDKKSASEFDQSLQEVMTTAVVVNCETSCKQIVDDSEPRDLIRAIQPKFKMLRDGDAFTVEIFKPQTYTFMEIEMINNITFFFETNVYNTLDAGDDDERIHHAIRERPPIYNEWYRTISADRIKKTVNFMAKNFENYVDIDSWIHTYRRTCLMNLDNEKPHVHYIHKKFVMTPEAIEDRTRYNATSSKIFHGELMEYAFHPDRLKNVLDENDDLFDRWLQK
jgi:hypothetical protein